MVFVVDHFAEELFVGCFEQILEQWNVIRYRRELKFSGASTLVSNITAKKHILVTLAKITQFIRRMGHSLQCLTPRV